jgi:GT2 family glycosyltransferase
MSSSVPPFTSRPFSVLAIVVVYRQRPGKSTSLITLEETVRRAAMPSTRVSILVADNTPGGHQPGPLSPGIEYRPYPQNPGLAGPYNDALATARREGFDWLLTLDQDTQLPPDFLDSMMACATRFAQDTRVAAVVPRIVDGGRPISPFRFVGGFLPKVLTGPVAGLAPLHASALNSASLLRVASLEAIGGYDPCFPLHNSDTRLYQQLDKAGYRVAVADGVIVPHEFSILRREERISPDRYRHMLADERDFWDCHMGPLGRLERTVRLMGRAVKGRLQRESAAFRRITAEELWFRLSHSRRARRRLRDGESSASSFVESKRDYAVEDGGEWHYTDRRDQGASHGPRKH